MGTELSDIEKRYAAQVSRRLRGQRSGAYDQPVVVCPYCGDLCEAEFVDEFVDIGVGMQQVSPYRCDNCLAVQIGPHDNIGRELTAEENKTGWYKGIRMKTHELKTDHEVFEAKLAGVKPWELRKNDRDFQVGDLLVEKETEFTGEQMLNEGLPLFYTGREIKERVTYIMRGPAYGLPAGWCIMTTAKI